MSYSVKPVLIIAEAGVNHNGDFEKAKRLIEVAAEAGADIVKFQTFKAEKLVTRAAKKAEYQVKNSGAEDASQFEMLKKLQLPDEWYPDLIDIAAKNKIKFLSTGFDEESIDFLDNLGIPLFKIPSGEVTNKPYIKAIARKGKPVILSTGMSDMEDIRKTLEILIAEGISKDKITVLHCNTEYPTPMKDVNLLAMDTIKNTFGVSVGYSDHTLGIEVPIAAVALGAEVIEKHFTLDRNLPGPDHRASLEPEELSAMVKSIRNIELAIAGDGQKRPSESEAKNASVARKSIHLARDVKKGAVIEEADLTMKRPGDGISPMDLEKVVGRIANRDLSVDDKLLWEYIDQ